MKICVLFLLITLSCIAAFPQGGDGDTPADAPMMEDTMSPDMNGGMNGMDMPPGQGTPGNGASGGMNGDDMTTTTAAPAGGDDKVTNEDLKMTLEEILELLKEHAMKDSDMDDKELKEILDKLMKNPKLMKQVAEALWWDDEEEEDDDMFGYIFDYFFDWRKRK